MVSNDEVVSWPREDGFFLHWFRLTDSYFNQIPSLVLQNTRNFCISGRGLRKTQKTMLQLLVTHSRESGRGLASYCLVSQIHSVDFTSEPPPSNESIAEINPTVLLLNDLDKLPRESATLEGYDQVTPWVLSPGCSLPLQSHQHKETCSKDSLTDK